MKRRNILKLTALAPFAALPVSARTDILLPHQAEACEAIKNNRTCLFIWPRGGSKTYTLSKVLNVDKIKLFHAARKGKNSFIYSAMGSYCFDELYERNFEKIEHRLKTNSKTVIFTSINEENSNWLLRNMKRFDHVDWRGLKEMPEYLYDQKFSEQIRKEIGEKRYLMEIESKITIECNACCTDKGAGKKYSQKLIFECGPEFKGTFHHEKN